MINQVFGAIAALGSAEAQNLLALAGENVLKKYQDSHAWEKLLNWNPSFQFASLSSDLANRLHK